MNINNTDWQKVRAWLYPLIAALLIMAITGYISWFTLQYETELKKRSSQSELSVICNRLETLMNQQIDRAQGLAVYNLDNPNASFEALTHFSEKLFTNQNGILKTVVLTKDTTVTFIYPLQGNESVMGVDLTTVSNQKDEVLLAKRSLRPVLTQPITLIQGGMGIIFRVPQTSYKDGISQSYVGLMNVVINFDRLLGRSGVLEATKQYHMRINQISEPDHRENEIFYTTDKPLLNPIRSEVNLKENFWMIELVPINGWNEDAYIYILVLGAGIFLSVLVFFYFRSLLRSKVQLNQMVTIRTQELREANTSLEDSLESLKTAQEQLIRAEKLAGLGELVAGVAHEINTPLGVGITLTSFIKEKENNLKLSFAENKVSRRELTDYFAETTEALDVMTTSLNKAAEIVRSFKNVAVEQSSLEMRKFNVSKYINDLLLSLTPKFKHSQFKIVLNCPESLEITSYPGAISQILTQLINNSLIHGFQGRASGSIHIEVQLVKDQVRMVYSDDGVGIPVEAQSKVFNPFFTTDKQNGSTGLGLHIVHNLATQVLKGQIQLLSETGSGTCFIINFSESQK